MNLNPLLEEDKNKFLNPLLEKNRCKCKKKSSRTKKRKSNIRREGKPLQYPKPNEILSKTFQMKYDRDLSPTAKFILNSFQNKYIYYAIDDILYLLKSNLAERDNLLAILYSPIISLQNNFSVNFFDIWIREVSIEEKVKNNKFLTKDSRILDQFNYITIKLFYKTRIPGKKQESFW